jgi:hypothetical protein
VILGLRQSYYLCGVRVVWQIIPLAMDLFSVIFRFESII